MDSTILIQNNLNNLQSVEKNTNGPLHFIEVKKTNTRSIKIPCANESIAKKVAYGLRKLKAESTISLLH